MRVGTARPASLPRLPRRGMGRACPRRPSPLRDAHRSKARRPASAGRRSSTSETGTGGRSPASTRRRWRAFHPRRSTGCCRIRRSCAPVEGRVDRRERPSGARGAARPTLDSYLWTFVEGTPIVNRWKTIGDIPAETDESRSMSRDLKRRGFRFVGPTVCYAFMQACGLVNDHVQRCFRWAEILADDESLDAADGDANDSSRRSKTRRRLSMPAH